LKGIEVNHKDKERLLAAKGKEVWYGKETVEGWGGGWLK
jgi:hypothetical protein